MSYIPGSGGSAALNATLTGATSSGILYVDSSNKIAEDISRLYYDGAGRLRIGTTNVLGNTTVQVHADPSSSLQSSVAFSTTTAISPETLVGTSKLGLWYANSPAGYSYIRGTQQLMLGAASSNVFDSIATHPYIQIDGTSITAFGNFGINQPNARTVLHVGAGNDVPLTPSALIYGSNAGDTGVALRDSANDIEVGLGTYSGLGYVGTMTATDMYFATNRTLRGVFTNTGNVGFGTTSPSSFNPEGSVVALTGFPSLALSLVGNQSTDANLSHIATYNMAVPALVSSIITKRYGANNSSSIDFKVMRLGTLATAMSMLPGGSVSVTNAATSMSIPFVDSTGSLAQSNTASHKFIWDNTNKWLAFGVPPPLGAFPAGELHITPSANGGTLNAKFGFDVNPSSYQGNVRFALGSGSLYGGNLTMKAAYDSELVDEGCNYGGAALTTSNANLASARIGLGVGQTATLNAMTFYTGLFVTSDTNMFRGVKIGNIVDIVKPSAKLDVDVTYEHTSVTTGLAVTGVSTQNSYVGEHIAATFTGTGTTGLKVAPEMQANSGAVIAVNIVPTNAKPTSTAVHTGLAVNMVGITSSGVTTYAAAFSGGNVGIGTTTPTETLTVTGSLRVTNATTTTTHLLSHSIVNPSGNIGTTVSTGYSGVWIADPIGTSIVTQDNNTTGTNTGSLTGLNVATTSVYYSLAKGLSTLRGAKITTSASSAVAVTDLYGLQLSTAAGTSVINLYGLYLSDQGTVTNRFGIYQTGNGTTNYFNGFVGAGTSTPAAPLHVQGTPGIVTAKFTTPVPGYTDPNLNVIQNRLETTGFTTTTLASIPLASDGVYFLDSKTVARRTGGSAGSAGDSAVYQHYTTAKRTASGAPTAVGASPLSTVYTTEDQSIWDATWSFSDNNLVLTVNGATDNTVTWHTTILSQQLTS